MAVSFQFEIAIFQFLTTHTCYCTDAEMPDLIRSLPSRNSSQSWWRSHRAIVQGSLSVHKNEHGYLAYRRFRAGNTAMLLAHQLSGIPTIFPTEDLGQAAAELCFPRPNRALGFLWWTCPAFYIF
jgi:hypothetical protein